MSIRNSSITIRLPFWQRYALYAPPQWLPIEKKKKKSRTYSSADDQHPFWSGRSQAKRMPTISHPSAKHTAIPKSSEAIPFTIFPAAMKTNLPFHDVIIRGISIQKRNGFFIISVEGGKSNLSVFCLVLLVLLILFKITLFQNEKFCRHKSKFKYKFRKSVLW